MDNYRLHIKVGAHEFQGEGPEDSVRKNFDDWKEMITSLSISSAPALGIDSPKSNEPEQHGDRGRLAPLDENLASKLFLVDEKSGLVTLKILPRGEERAADATLLVLLGFRRLKEEDDVLVTQLKQALKRSGCNVDRVDKVVARYEREGFINKGGSGKGGKYSLTNSGAEKAATLACGLF